MTLSIPAYDLSRAVVPRISEIPKTLPVRRDLAFVVDEGMTVQRLLDIIAKESLSYVVEVGLFDVYRGKGVAQGKKSLAFRVLLQDTHKTLTDSEIEPIITRLVAVLEQHGAQLRI